MCVGPSVQATACVFGTCLCFISRMNEAGSWVQKIDRQCVCCERYTRTQKKELLPNDRPTHVVYVVPHVVTLNLSVHVCVYARQARLVGIEPLQL